MNPAEPQPHFLLSSAYRNLGNEAESKAELEEFQKLTKANMERRMPYDAILKGAGDKSEDLKPVQDPDSQ